MPADLSKEAMTIYFKNALEDFVRTRGPSLRAKKANDLFTYILTHFNHFIANFKMNVKFFKVIRGKCIEFIEDDEVVSDFEYLVHTSVTLLEKLNDAILEIEQNECGCLVCFLRRNAHIQYVQYAESVGLVG